MSEETDASDVEGSINEELEDLQDLQEDDEEEEKEEDSFTASDDPEATRAMRPRVIEIPSSGKIRQAKDLFNDDDESEDDRDNSASQEASGQLLYNSANAVLPAKLGRKRGTPRDADHEDRRSKRPPISVPSTSEDEGYVSIDLESSGTKPPDRNARSGYTPPHTPPYGLTPNDVILPEGDEEVSHQLMTIYRSSLTLPIKGFR